MRTLIALALMLLALPALAQDWGQYENGRFGYRVDVPPGFLGEPEAANGDGRVYRSADGTQQLRVYGGNNLSVDFEASIATGMGYATDAGWVLTYTRVTPSWASYSGSRAGMIFYSRAIALCGGSQFAAFEIEYPQRDIARMDAVIERLVTSLRATGDGSGC